jgi:hypothetical protein
MQSLTSLIVVRLLPVVFVVAAAIAYVLYVEGDHPYVLRNTLPMLVALLLAILTLKIGNGHWAGSGWRWPLGTLGFALPALGLSIYLHYGYSIDLHGMYSESVYPRELFRYLPFFTSFAGGIGFAIGWIAGRNV